MPPKKNIEEDPSAKLALLGRAKNSLSMGLVGLPNVGKSLTFTVLTQVQVPSENYPFCTIDPNTARVAVPDKRFDWMCDLYKPKSKVPTYLDVCDIAGLIKGASEGQGLGNAFLSNIKACDGIYHIIRVFDDDTITHVEGDIDPVRDCVIINNELIAKDLQQVVALLDDTKKKLERKPEKELQLTVPVLEKIKLLLEEKKDLFTQDWSILEIKVLNELLLLTCKPVVYLLNMSEKDYVRQKNKYVPKIMEFIKDRTPNASVIIYSASLEAKLLALGNNDARQEYLKTLSETCESHLDKIIKTGYKDLNLIHYFTSGADEVRCWTVRKYTKAPDAAGVIHTDFKEHFICADVFKYKDLKKLGSEQEVKAQGKLMMQGKEYIVEDGDIMFFKHNARGGATKKK
ncbi:GTP dependent nucleic acid binding protein [Spironucleus salmonicida]|uniref:Obg-like ATPase 1 n=1 Tax=Spironucleus salmonicida TaxID=348837 RepID=V6LW64_9EUKA|nr:GTP dependent nucleic acid binding protein [Spironucleus salmonicida]|eukprot:EST45054.1 GTP-binding protein [Spironucleus salmonicida]